MSKIVRRLIEEFVAEDGAVFSTEQKAREYNLEAGLAKFFEPEVAGLDCKIVRPESYLAEALAHRAVELQNLLAENGYGVSSETLKSVENNLGLALLRLEQCLRVGGFDKKDSEMVSAHIETTLLALTLQRPGREV